MDYRKEIDGLRALAVLPVILFHAGFETFSGGFVGVDVFFVISGYLITSIILKDLKEGHFSIVTFYERRARRILPALFLVILSCIPFAWLLLSPADLISFSKSIVAISLFVSNIYLWKDGGYFETAAELKPLLHTWSLSVEEQYYVLFPILMTLLWKHNTRLVLFAFCFIFVASLAVGHWAAYAFPNAAFYLLPARAWELLIGAFAAYYLPEIKRKYSSYLLSELSSWLGIILISYAVLTYSKSTPFPGIYALVPTLGATLVILFASQETWAGKFIGNKLLVSIGLVSYSAYLWHQPVFAYSRHWFNYIDRTNATLLVTLVFIISFISWKFVERPFREKKRFDYKTIFKLSILGTLILLTLGVLMSRIDLAREEAMAKTLSTSNFIYSSNINERKFIKNRIHYERSDPQAIVIGSSRAMQATSRGVGYDLLNLSVSGASIEDILAIWNLSSKKFDPKYVFLGADPWIFNSNSGQTRWLSLGREYIEELSTLSIDKEVQIPSENSLSNFNIIAGQIYDAINLSKISAVDDSPSYSDKIRRDGSRIYNLSYSNKSPKEVERGALGYASYAMSEYLYSAETRFILETFIAKLKAKNLKIVFVLSPYHPKLYEHMRLKDKKFLTIEAIYREISDIYDIQVIGSYDPHRVGCSPADFYDGMHPKEVCMDKVFSMLNK